MRKFLVVLLLSGLLPLFAENPVTQKPITYKVCVQKSPMAMSYKFNPPMDDTLAQFAWGYARGIVEDLGKDNGLVFIHDPKGRGTIIRFTGTVVEKRATERLLYYLRLCYSFHKYELACH